MRVPLCKTPKLKISIDHALPYTYICIFDLKLPLLTMYFMYYYCNVDPFTSVVCATLKQHVSLVVSYCIRISNIYIQNFLWACICKTYANITLQEYANQRLTRTSI